MRARAATVLVIGLVGWGTLPARAERPRLDTELATQAARAHYDAGVVYYEGGDARRALAEFLAAQRDDDRAALDYDIASCYERLGDPARAARHLRRYLDRDGRALGRAELEARIRQHEQQVGELHVRTSPAGARVTIDGDPADVADGSVVRLSAGTHHVTAAREGHVPASVDVVVTRGARSDAFIDLGVAVSDRRRKRRALAIGLGLTGGVLIVGTAVVLGVVLGTRSRDEPYVGNVGVITVNP